MSKIPIFPDAPIYVMYMLVFAYLQILFAFFLLLHHLPLCWYFCHLDTVFAASLPPFLLTSATRGALVLKHNPTIFMQMFQIYDFWLCNKNYFQAAFSFQHSTRNTSNYFQEAGRRPSISRFIEYVIVWWVPVFQHPLLQKDVCFTLPVQHSMT